MTLYSVAYENLAEESTETYNVGRKRILGKKNNKKVEVKGNRKWKVVLKSKSGVARTAKWHHSLFAAV